MEHGAEIQKFFNTMVETEASDLYLTVAKPPMYRIDGKIRAVGDDAFSPQDLLNLSDAMMNEKQRKDFGETLEMNMAMSLPGVARFRVNIFRQRGSVGMVIRRIKAEVTSLDEMGLPAILKEIAMTKRGLVLVVGATGSGKSTSLAAMIDHRNSSEAGHIITIEDPIEFVHRHKQSIVTQREVGFDTHSFQSALKNTLRQAPDVILIGEIRDRNHGSGDSLRRNRSPLSRYSAFEQRQSGDRADHEFFFVRAARADLFATFFESASDRVATLNSERRRQTGGCA
jgi:twitching motility protein PilU